jgi:predicted nucleic acid-binding Zn ribbon protein
MGFNKITDILRQVGERYPSLSKRLKEAHALSRWEIAVGPAIAKHTRAIRVQEATLWVEVDHPIWKSELHHRKRQILEILNRNDSSPSEKLPEIKDLLLLDPRNFD